MAFFVTAAQTGLTHQIKDFTLCRVSLKCPHSLLTFVTDPCVGFLPLLAWLILRPHSSFSCFLSSGGLPGKCPQASGVLSQAWWPHAELIIFLSYPAFLGHHVRTALGPQAAPHIKGLCQVRVIGWWSLQIMEPREYFSLFKAK